MKKMKLATLNVGSMKSKGFEIVKVMKENNIKIMLLQETKWKGMSAKEIGAGYKIFYAGENKRRNGVGIILDPDLKDGVTEVNRVNDRIMLLKLEIGQEMFNIVCVYAPQVGSPQQDKESFWNDLDEVVQRVPAGEKLIVGGDFNGHVGARNDGFEEVHGGYGFGLMNDDGLNLLDFALSYNFKIVNTQFKKRENHLITYRSGPNQSQIDYISVRNNMAKDVRNCKVLPHEQVTSQHRILIMDYEWKRKQHQQKKGQGVKRIRWWKMKEGALKEEFVGRAKNELGNLQEENVEELWNDISRKMITLGEEVFGRASGKKKKGVETWWWNEEVEEKLKIKRQKLKKWKETNDQGDKEEYRRANKIAKKTIEMAKREKYEDFYEELHSVEGAKSIFRIAAEKDEKSKDVKMIRTIKDENGVTLVEDEEIRERWRAYFEKLMNEENERGLTEREEVVEGPIDCVSIGEIRAVLRKMKNGKATGPDEIPVEIWKSLGREGEEVLQKLFNTII